MAYARSPSAPTPQTELRIFEGDFKRVIFGTYHFGSKAYLERYIDEAVFRYNTRKASESTRFADMFAKSIGICDYKAVKALKVA